jgi:hypothetical protein
MDRTEILTTMSACSMPVNSAAVNWDLWSVLTISGLPKRSSSSLKNLGFTLLPPWLDKPVFFPGHFLKIPSLSIVFSGRLADSALGGRPV